MIDALGQLIAWRGKPEKIRVDNGPEFIAEALKQLFADQGIELVFIEKGKPSQNGFIERFNRTFREDALDAYLFEHLEQAQQYVNQWMYMYNNERPHSAQARLTPTAFLLKYG